ncbi:MULTISPECIES: hypothetical protein [unclassified Streptomyces]|uniref:hypothetical protein n=1 Tax=unclassified Streptomyces TaxID=2593676 RepID=UPI000DC7632B|nr:MULTISPECIES: hypothetical protein [unclassified Streptomyces]AWZ09327.1 hypothetical protein DRB89_38130 [Streptomyces sp. ICC4]AWZ15769.1 hypothetical protein DRB96_29875 [Streptomyces sp. ICC1]
MSIELDYPEFPYEDSPGWITWAQKPWNGVLVMVDGIPFKAGDKVTFDVSVYGDSTGQTLAAWTRGVVDVPADITSVGYTIPWDGVLDAITEGFISAFYTLDPVGGGEPTTSQEGMVWYSLRRPDGTVCGPDD